MQHQSLAKLFTIALLTVLGGCATTVKNPKDPYESWNREVQKFNDGLDKHVMKPVAEAYDWITPDFAHVAVSNFFSNIDDVGVSINSFLQGKLPQAVQINTRILVNSTIGIAGFIDVASSLSLPKYHEDFDQTLGSWGVPTGPYLVLPFFGPSSPRGVSGLVGDTAMNPISYIGSPAISVGLGVLNIVDLRANNLATEKVADEAALDRYEFFRDSYLNQRRFLVLDGNIPKKATDDDFDIDKALDEQLQQEKE